MRLLLAPFPQIIGQAPLKRAVPEENGPAGIAESMQPWNPAPVTGTYMFTPGLAKPHVLQSKELPLNTGKAGRQLTQEDESKAPKASNKFPLLGTAGKPRPVQIDSTSTDNDLK